MTNQINNFIMYFSDSVCTDGCEQLVYNYGELSIAMIMFA